MSSYGIWVIARIQKTQGAGLSKIANLQTAYLSGKLAAESVSEIQDAGVIASVKHFIGNEQEYDRYPEGSIAAISSNIDDKTITNYIFGPLPMQFMQELVVSCLRTTESTTHMRLKIVKRKTDFSRQNWALKGSLSVVEEDYTLGLWPQRLELT